MTKTQYFFEVDELNNSASVRRNNRTAFSQVTQLEQRPDTHKEIQSFYLQSKPVWGDVQYIADYETPVFWAYGVTPQNATRIVKLKLCITQYPGKHVDYRFNETAWATIKRLANKIKTHS